MTLEEIKTRVNDPMVHAVCNGDLRYLYAIPYEIAGLKCFNISDEIKSYLKSILYSSLLIYSKDVESRLKKAIKPSNKEYFLYVLQFFYKYFDEIFAGNIELDGDNGLLSSLSSSNKGQMT